MQSKKLSSRSQSLFSKTHGITFQRFNQNCFSVSTDFDPFDRIGNRNEWSIIRSAIIRAISRHKLKNTISRKKRHCIKPLLNVRREQHLES